MTKLPKLTLYMAYGANTSHAKMAERCPAAKYITNVTLHNHKLAFRGYADALEEKGSEVQCAVWALTPDCEAALDEYEGYPKAYIKRYVKMKIRNVSCLLMMYVMRSATRAPKEPSAEYEQTLRTGYTECGLPIKQIEDALARAKAWVAAHPVITESTPQRSLTRDLFMEHQQRELQAQYDAHCAAEQAMIDYQSEGA